MKITREGIAVVEGDELLSKYVEEQGRLDVAHDLLDQLHQYIPVGGVVADIGACIGDHTITYSDWVGLKGQVHAFEPNPQAYSCLDWNMSALCKYPNVRTYNNALGSSVLKHASFVLETRNLGAAYLTSNGVGNVEIVELDAIAEGDHWDKLDFVKIDAEGFEPMILDGAIKTLSRLRPVLLIEVNTMALGRSGYAPEDIYSRLKTLGYSFPYCTQHEFDLVCLPDENTQ